MFLPYPSSAFVPIDTMPSLAAAASPRTSRSRRSSRRCAACCWTGPSATTPWQALAWCGGILRVVRRAAAVFFRRRTA